MENEKTNEYVNEVKVVCTGVEIQMEQASENIRRIAFVTEKGNITWKPKKDQETFQDGMKILETVQMKVSDLPDKLREIARITKEKGSCELKVDYTLMKTQQDGEPKEYRFITSEKTFDKWEIEV